MQGGAEPSNSEVRVGPKMQEKVSHIPTTPFRELQRQQMAGSLMYILQFITAHTSREA